MRLIDADKILEYLDEETYSTDRAFASAIVQSLVNEIITPQPTVNAIVIPPNATNGDIIRTMFSNTYSKEDDYDIFTNLDGGTRFTYDWWNEKYKVESEVE